MSLIQTNTEEKERSRREDITHLKQILDIERGEYEYLKARLHFLTEFSVVNARLDAHTDKLSRSLSDDPLLMRNILDDLVVLLSSARIALGKADYTF